MPEFHLTSPGGSGTSCNADGAFIGAVPLLDRLRKDGEDAWHPCDCEELSEQISAHYGLPVDMASKRGGLKAIANALNDGDIARAQIATVLLGIPDLPPLSKGARPRERMIKLIRDLDWSGMLKWDSDEHPRWPAGTPGDNGGKKGGKFAPKGQGNGTGASSAPPSEAPGAARVTTRHDLGASPPQTKPIDAKQEGFWQTLGSRLSHEAKSALRQIGQMQVAQSESDFAAASEGANAVSEDLRAYAEYRRQLWLDSNGHPFQVPAIEADDPLSERVALMGHFVLEPKAPLMRPATNADWIDPLINLASLGAMGAGIPFKLAGPAVEALGEIAAPVAESDVLIGNSGFRSVGEFTNAATTKYQALYDEGYASTMERVNQGLLPNDPLLIGNKTDSLARVGLRDWLKSEEIGEGPGQVIQVNRRLYDPLGSGNYRVPDVYIPDSQTILDGSLQFKNSMTSQIADYHSFSGGARIIVVRPSSAPEGWASGSYGIVR